MSTRPCPTSTLKLVPVTEAHLERMRREARTAQKKSGKNYVAAASSSDSDSGSSSASEDEDSEDSTTCLEGRSSFTGRRSKDDGGRRRDRARRSRTDKNELDFSSRTKTDKFGTVQQAETSNHSTAVLPGEASKDSRGAAPSFVLLKKKDRRKRSDAAVDLRTSNSTSPYQIVEAERNCSHEILQRQEHQSAEDHSLSENTVTSSNCATPNTLGRTTASLSSCSQICSEGTSSCTESRKTGHLSLTSSAAQSRTSTSSAASTTSRMAR
eukprot:GSA120T00021813001.1